MLNPVLALALKLSQIKLCAAKLPYKILKGRSQLVRVTKEGGDGFLGHSPSEQALLLVHVYI